MAILCASFNGLNLEQVQELGDKIASLTQRLYEEKHNLVVLPTSPIEVFSIAISGPPGAGKSTITTPIVWNLDAHDVKNSGLEINMTKDGISVSRTIISWDSYHSESLQQQNIMRDCLTSPELQPKNLDVPTYPAEKRVFSGIDILEHPSVEEPLKSMKIFINLNPDEPDLRDITISTEHDSLSHDAWDSFITDITPA